MSRAKDWVSVDCGTMHCKNRLLIFMKITVIILEVPIFRTLPKVVLLTLSLYYLLPFMTLAIFHCYLQRMVKFHLIALNTFGLFDLNIDKNITMLIG